VAEHTYPADPAETGLALFQRWFGAHFARSTAMGDWNSEEGVLSATLTVGRRWDVAVTLLNTLATETNVGYEAERAAIEKRLDIEGRSIALWAPRGAPLPTGEPGLSELMYALDQAKALEDGRLEVRRPISLYLRRTSTTGSVVTVLGGMSAHWAQFTNRVPGSFQMNSMQLYRLPQSQDERDALAESIVLAAGQPEVDETQVIAAEDVWTANDLREGRSCVLGSPQGEGDEQSATLRRGMRRLLKRAEALRTGSPAARALVVMGATTYAEEEKLSWALRGMDPTLYSGYDILAVLADGMLKPLLEPARQTLPWDAPVG
jgi:hypothetical protein